MKTKRIARRSFLLQSAVLGAGSSLPLLVGASPFAWTQLVAPSSAGTRLQALLLKVGGGGDYASTPVDNLSASFYRKQLANSEALLKESDLIEGASLTKDEHLDLRFARSILAGRVLTGRDMVRWKKDPRIYLQLRNLSALATMADPDAARADQVLSLLNDIPPRLVNGEKNLEFCIPRFRELSLFMIDNALVLFRSEIPAFAARVPSRQAELAKANIACVVALERFQHFVRDTLPKKPLADVALGRQTYDAMLKQQFLLDYTGESLYDFAWEQFRGTVSQAQEVARKIDPSRPWLEVAAKIKEEGPDPLKMIEVHQQWVDKARDFVHEHKLVPIPWPNRVDVVARPEYLRKTSYYGNFSGAKKPNKDGVLVGQWQINTFLPSWNDSEKRDYMLEHDWGVIIDTAPHETFCGHHVQMLYQLHNPNSFRRNSSISIFSEGWGLYVEHLMQESGFFPNEKIHLRQLQLRLWRIARVIYDSGMNIGKLSYDAAIKLMVEQVGFQRWAAELEVDSAAERPGYMIGYFMGCSEIQKMRDQFKKARSEAFTYADFHERLLRVGCMPPTLMREGLMNSLVTSRGETTQTALK